MFFSLSEISRWLGVTAYEIWVWFTSLAIFSVLLSIKCDTKFGERNLSWYEVFSPLFVGDAMNAYFIITVFIRQYLKNKFKPAILRMLWSLLQLTLIFLFEFLLCWKLISPTHFEYSEVMAPLFILSQFIMIRACQLH